MKILEKIHRKLVGDENFEVILATKRFKTYGDYVKWLYTMRPIWKANWREHVKHMKKAQLEGYQFRMSEIKRRKTLTLEQRQKEKAKRQVEGVKARERCRARKLAIV